MADEAMPKSNPLANVLRLPYADATRGVRHVFVRDYETSAEIGVWAHEKGAHQRIRINVDLSVKETLEHHEDQLANVVCYNEIVKGIQTILEAGHINLVETLAERIADLCLVDLRVIGARVKVEKLEAVEGALSVGVEIERHRPS
ncbi:dihydroneopterin aldolase [Gimibacter soli]|uniref:7,8-dihydroneopterin aldolase n=1 Tax=Gimibacter soli TaxID=3024400 RepID=A0AAE9XXH2_9PROT|nr:dihydroneopterin aldolase [Gimibacter soli]WCL55464.1 dihydroneopterin aldolase [Gimibacter soli]